MTCAGISRDEVVDDPQLGNKRNELITLAARHLAGAGMIIFDRQSGAFAITDLGRIAAKYYIRHGSIEIFNKEFKPRMSEADVLAMLCMSTEVCMLLESLSQCLNRTPVRSNTSPRIGNRRAQSVAGNYTVRCQS